MTPLLGHSMRRERAFERLYRKHLAGVYRYALAVMCDPGDAEAVTRAAFRSASRAFARGERPRNARAWLLVLTHAACRRRAGLADEDDEDAFSLQSRPAAVETLVLEVRPALRRHPEAALSCEDAGRAISRRLDGRLARREQEALRRHLRTCGRCAGFARSQTRRRPAWQALANVPVPASVRASFSRPQLF